MKKALFILFFLPLLSFGQNDLESRYFTINENSLPSVEELTIINYDLPKINKKVDIRDFANLNVDNYRTKVDMVGALASENRQAPSFVDIKEIQSEFTGFGADKNYRSDGKTRVTNTVYNEMRGLSLLDPCPPFGVCARCAPYRMGRGF